MTSKLHSIDIRMLRVGATLSAPIFGEDATVKLLGVGIPITLELVQKLQRRGIQTVRVSTSDFVRLQTFRPQGTSKTAAEPHNYIVTDLESDATQTLDKALKEPVDLCLPEQTNPVRASLHRPTGHYGADQVEAVAEQNEQHVTFLDELFQQAQRSSRTDFQPLGEIWSDVAEQATNDIDLFACMGITPFAADYPCRHSIHTAKTAAVIGVMMGLDGSTLSDLTRGCLLHDLGMLQLESKAFTASRKLVPSELRQIADHPVQTLKLLEAKLDSFSLNTLSVVYQVHERCNGNGYPRGVTAEHIHPLAKIAAVADSFVALLSDRPHRKGMQPYYAMATLLQSVRDGLFDSEVVRALLSAVSLFPIGSHVKLSDGQVARVIRSNWESYDRPMVEAWHPNRTYAPSTVVDLLQTPDIAVEKPLLNLNRAS